MGTLSSRFAARRPTLDDAPGILAVGIARDIADLGYPDWSLDDVREELTQPGIELERDGWVVCEEGRIAAAALVSRGDARVYVHPEACGAGVGSWLREQVEGRASERGEPVVRQSVGGSNDTARELLAAAGYRAEQRFWRMTRELDGDLSEPSWPAGLSGWPYATGTDDDVAAHALVQDAFRAIPGNIERELGEWHAATVGGAQFAPDLSTVVAGPGGAGSLAGVALCERWEDRQGYVAYLAVAADQRGRGLGRALLAESLRKMRAAGLRSAALAVNGRNESATRLYESVGMRIASRAERWEKPLGRGAP